ncbi:MAG: OsmC family protein [Desulfofustis sp.]|nr:OsmC family protein [Desulfofustis sp.]NNF45176.1 OsmC family protein [Desulfofustis sp.]NNK58279.1 OsmC family protein [Desulfofustis sp.]
MAIRLKQKIYGPLHLQRENPGHFTYTTDAGYQARAGAPASAEQAPPSDLIMAALASCIGISLEMAAEDQNVDPGAIDIFVNGAKARDLPHRFGSFEATVHLNDIEDRDLAVRLLNQAKQICTVSNTLNAEVIVLLGEKGEK